MVSDQLTFFLSFAAVFGALAWYLLRLEREVNDLQERLRDAEAGAAMPATDGDRQDGPGIAGAEGPAEGGPRPGDADSSGGANDPDAANAKNRHTEDRS